MSNDPPAVNLAGLFDAFMHPPRLHYIGHRAESADGQILIVSHVELWSWRLVVRGTRANKQAGVGPLRGFGQLDTVSDQAPGSLRGVLTVRSDPGEVERRRAEAMWFTNWQISDDLGTKYRTTGSHRGGNEAWADFAIGFDPPTPIAARHLTIATADGEVIEIGLRTTP